MRCSEPSKYLLCSRLPRGCSRLSIYDWFRQGKFSDNSNICFSLFCVLTEFQIGSVYLSTIFHRLF